MDGPELFVFQDLVDRPQDLRESHKSLEPYFRVTYIYLPEWKEWIHPNALNHFESGFRDEILPLFEETKEPKTFFLSGISSRLWVRLLDSLKTQTCTISLTSPESLLWNPLDSLSEFTRYFWEKPGIQFFAWAQIQPILHFLSNLKTDSYLKDFQSKGQVYIYRTDSSLSSGFRKSTESFLPLVPKAKMTHLPGFTWSNVKNSATWKKLILQRTCDEYKVKKEKYWVEFLRLN